MEQLTLYVVMSGYGVVDGGSEIRFISLDYERAVTKAEEILELENRMVEDLNSRGSEPLYLPLHKVNPVDREALPGERILDLWKNSQRILQIVEFKTDVDYTPDYMK